MPKMAKTKIFGQAPSADIVRRLYLKPLPLLGLVHHP
jgi:hypothetical protein